MSDFEVLLAMKKAITASRELNNVISYTPAKDRSSKEAAKLGLELYTEARVTLLYTQGVALGPLDPVKP